MRRAPKLDLAPLLGALAEPSEDETTGRILDAAAAVLASGGFRRCTVEEIAAQAELGRTTLYRRFDGRDEIVHAVLARELRRLFDAVTGSVGHLERIEDQVVEGFLATLAAARDSPMLPLLRTEPDLLMFLVADSGPVLELVTSLMVVHLQAAVAPQAVDTDAARHGAEVVFRLAVSFVLMPDTTLPLGEPDRARASLHALLDPMLAELLAPRDVTS